MLAAPPHSAVYHADNGWTLTDHLLAFGMEQRAGLVDVTKRIPRTGVPDSPPQQRAKPVNPNRIDSWDSMPLEELERLRAENYAKGPSPSKVIGPQRK